MQVQLEKDKYVYKKTTTKVLAVDQSKLRPQASWNAESCASASAHKPQRTEAILWRRVSQILKDF